MENKNFSFFWWFSISCTRLESQFIFLSEWRINFLTDCVSGAWLVWTFRLFSWIGWLYCDSLRYMKLLKWKSFWSLEWRFVDQIWYLLLFFFVNCWLCRLSYFIVSVFRRESLLKQIVFEIQLCMGVAKPNCPLLWFMNAMKRISLFLSCISACVVFDHDTQLRALPWRSVFLVESVTFGSPFFLFIKRLHWILYPWYNY